LVFVWYVELQAARKNAQLFTSMGSHPLGAICWMPDL